MIPMDKGRFLERATDSRPTGARATRRTAVCVWLMLMMWLSSWAPAGFAQDVTDDAADVDPFAGFADEALREAVQKACGKVEAKD
ncbi:MAG: hypothetical protein NXI04_22405, partial [Planctomycetaceae bacterium]|nr:hypothetical protein [Planctomycetaceae bacterium]